MKELHYICAKFLLNQIFFFLSTLIRRENSRLKYMTCFMLYLAFRLYSLINHLNFLDFLCSNDYRNKEIKPLSDPSLV